MSTSRSSANRRETASHASKIASLFLVADMMTPWCCQVVRMGEWTPHDLRRTGAAMMQAWGISLDVIDRCQNRVLAGSRVRRHYLHNDYAEEKKRLGTC